MCIREQRQGPTIGKGVGIANILTLATWNIRSLAHEATELWRVWNRGMNIAVITKTKEKLKGIRYIEDQMSLYSGVS